MSCARRNDPCLFAQYVAFSLPFLCPQGAKFSRAAARRGAIFLVQVDGKVAIRAHLQRKKGWTSVSGGARARS